MKSIKRQVINIALFLIFNLTVSPLFAINYTVLTTKNIEKIAIAISTDYGPGPGTAFYEEVYRFLKLQLSDNLSAGLNKCGIVRPEVVFAEYGQRAAFEWDPVLSSGKFAVTYDINNFNMTTWDMEHKSTPETKILFEPLAPAFYIFSFIANCGISENKSNPTIVIADKDIFFQPPQSLKQSSPESPAQWQVRPNPFTRKITIQLQKSSSRETFKVSPLQIRLCDINGRVVRKIENLTSIDPLSFSLSTTDLKTGFYTLYIQTAGQVFQQRMIKF